MKSLTDDKREVPTISVFIKQGISEQQARDRAELLQELTEIDKVVVVPRDQALDDFRQITGFAETLETLDENPLPHVLVITPHMQLIGDPDLDLERLSSKLQNYPEVDLVQMDIEWVQRLRGILNISERAILVISVLLALTVLLVVGNTIKLNIENRKEEIKVTKLIGATSSYIRRPFLYGGVWYGLFGGILSLVLVHIALLFLVAPVQELARLYGSNFVISGMGVKITLYILLATGGVAGFLNVMAGGGSALTIPIMIFMGYDATVANGSNRIAIQVEALTAVATFKQQNHSDFPLSMKLALMTLPGGILGAFYAVKIDDALFTKLLGVVMLGHVMSLVRFLLVDLFKHGVGFVNYVCFSFISIVWTLVKINMHKVFIVMVFTVPAVILFIATGNVDWFAAVALSLGMMVGTWLAVKMAIKKGEKIVRVVLGVALLIIAVKLFLL
ncbi:Cell division protein FtsX [Nymphon striatum]|nr:Cell division protein FtsX [Nymphon striatum]